MNSAIDGVVIGGAGGAIAGIMVYLVQYLHNKILDLCGVGLSRFPG